MSQLSPQAIISQEVKLGNNVIISPFCIIEGDVTIGDNTIIYPYVHIKGPVNIGSDNQIFNNVTIGLVGQHSIPKRSDEQKIIIGNGNIFRENVTIHAPIFYEDTSISMHTEIGNHCFLMVNSHVAHNTILKDHVIFANGVLPAGCCIFYNNAFISGNVLIHQYVRIGSYAMISGGSRIGRDIPPFMLVSSFYGLISGINMTGIRRAGFSIEERHIIKNIFKIFKNSNGLRDAEDKIFQVYYDQNLSVVDIVLEFLKHSRRGISEFGNGKEAKDSLC